MDKTLIERLEALAVRVEKLLTDWGDMEEAETRDAIARDIRALRATGEGEWPDDAAVGRAADAYVLNGKGGGSCSHSAMRDALLAAAPTPAEPLEREILDFITMVPEDRTHKLLVERGWVPPVEPLRGESRFFIDHGIVHDRLTGKHLRGTDEYGDKASDLLAVLQELESRSLLQITRAKLRQQIANDTDDEPEASSPLRDAGAVAYVREFMECGTVTRELEWSDEYEGDKPGKYRPLIYGDAHPADEAVRHLTEAAGSWGDFFKAYHRAAESGLPVDWERAAEKAMQWQRRVSEALAPFAQSQTTAAHGEAVGRKPWPLFDRVEFALRDAGEVERMPITRAGAISALDNLREYVETADNAIASMRQIITHPAPAQVDAEAAENFRKGWQARDAAPQPAITDAAQDVWDLRSVDVLLGLQRTRALELEARYSGTTAKEMQAQAIDRLGAALAAPQQPDERVRQEAFNLADTVAACVKAWNSDADEQTARDAIRIALFAAHPTPAQVDEGAVGWPKKRLYDGPITERDSGWNDAIDECRAALAAAAKEVDREA